MKPWMQWETLADVPQELRDHHTMESLAAPQDSAQQDQLVRAMTQACIDGVLEALYRERIMWVCRALIMANPAMPKRAVLRAVAIQVGRSEAYVRLAYYGGARTPQERAS